MFCMDFSKESGFVQLLQGCESRTTNETIWIRDNVTQFVRNFFQYNYNIENWVWQCWGCLARARTLASSVLQLAT